jgi:glycerophosphoryl diester phosphodiesterase
MGVDVLETDLRSTADGTLVLIHDSTVDRTTNGRGPIVSYTLSELQTLDAGYHWSSDGRTFPFRGKGLTVPTLEEVFTAFSDMRMNIDIKQKKPSIVAPFCRMIRHFNMQEKVMVASFKLKNLREFRRQCPEIATSASRAEALLFYSLNFIKLASALRLEAHALQVPEKYAGVPLLTRHFVAAAHRRNIKVHAWTVNETADMQRLLNLRLDGIVTDYPDRLMELLASPEDSS